VAVTAGSSSVSSAVMVGIWGGVRTGFFALLISPLSLPLLSSHSKVVAMVVDSGGGGETKVLVVVVGD
jgi:hypothetical protein